MLLVNYCYIPGIPSSAPTQNSWVVAEWAEYRPGSLQTISAVVGGPGGQEQLRSHHLREQYNKLQLGGQTNHLSAILYWPKMENLYIFVTQL
jgi:hypothetical protein